MGSEEWKKQPPTLLPPSNSTTGVSCARRRWQSISGIRFQRCLFSASLEGELERVKKEAVYQNRVFFIRTLGFITPSEAPRISFEETVRFEKIHEVTYRDFGFELVSVEPGSVAKRVAPIKASIG
jgi:predicted ATPase